jgi:hypothetical protein
VSTHVVVAVDDVLVVGPHDISGLDPSAAKDRLYTLAGCRNLATTYEDSLWAMLYDAYRLAYA